MGGGWGAAVGMACVWREVGLYIGAGWVRVCDMCAIDVHDVGLREREETASPMRVRNAPPRGSSRIARNRFPAPPPLPPPHFTPSRHARHCDLLDDVTALATPRVPSQVVDVLAVCVFEDELVVRGAHSVRI